MKPNIEIPYLLSNLDAPLFKHDIKRFTNSLNNVINTTR